MLFQQGSNHDLSNHYLNLDLSYFTVNPNPKKEIINSLPEGGEAAVGALLGHDVPPVLRLAVQQVLHGVGALEGAAVAVEAAALYQWDT